MMVATTPEHRRIFVTETDLLIQEAATPRAALTAFREAFPSSPRSDENIWILWHVARGIPAEEVRLPDRILNPRADLAGHRVRLRGFGSSLDGRTGTVRRTNPRTREALVALDRTETLSWVGPENLVLEGSA